jgi:DnaJ-class molecular chaperone
MTTKHQEKCERCRGRGTVYNYFAINGIGILKCCPDCKGTGWIKKVKKSVK